MAILKLTKVAFQGVAAAVPENTVYNADFPYLKDKEKQFVISNIGINERRVAPKEMTTADLCEAAANRLLEELAWKKEEIAILVFISQTPDYLTPCTAGVLQHKLGLPHHCLAFDINLGCSAYPYGLSVVAGLLSQMQGSKALLLVGDKSSQLVGSQDKSTAMLFSDAGTATALEYQENAPPMWFELCSDGGGYQSLMVTGGGGRQFFSEESLKITDHGKGIIRNELNLIMKGLDVFKFALKRVPPSIRQLYKESGVSQEDIDYFVFHQANKLINKTLGKQLKIAPEKMPSTLARFGNSSSASIPLTLVDQLGKTLDKETNTLLFCGFGVGLSWGTAILEVANLPNIPLLELK